MNDRFVKVMKTLFIFLLIFPDSVSTGPWAYGACQTACNAGAVLCYNLAGLVFGTVTISAAATCPVGWGVWLASAASSTLGPAAQCSAIQGVCMAGCVPLLVAPSP